MLFLIVVVQKLKFPNNSNCLLDQRKVLAYTGLFNGLKRVPPGVGISYMAPVITFGALTKCTALRLALPQPPALLIGRRSEGRAKACFRMTEGGAPKKGRRPFTLPPMTARLISSSCRLYLPMFQFFFPLHN
jgi:hypothetical protein